MGRQLRDFGLVALLAVLWFGSVYFAVAALFPRLALAAAFLATAVALSLYIVLVVVQMDDQGLPVALLFSSPVICVTAGVIWWGLRLLGLWK